MLKQDKETVLKVIQKQKENNRKTPLVTIAILNYNGVEYLESFLPSVVDDCHDDCEIVVIDNYSTDESIAFLEEWYPEIRIVSLHKNFGFSGGYNMGMKEIESKYTLILNSDVRLSHGATPKLLSTIDKTEKIIAVQPCILSAENEEIYEYAGAAGGMIDYLGYPFCRGRVLSSIEKLNPDYKASEIFWASGAAMMVRTANFKAMGGFDSDYFAHQEEIDFCWRAKKAGYSVLYEPEAQVFHLGGGTLSYEHPQKTFLNFRNNIFTLIKNEPYTKLIWLLPLRFILDIIASFHFLIGGKFRNALAVLKAYLNVVLSFRKYITKKSYYDKIIQINRIDQPNLKAMINKSILWQFYVLGKRKSSEIN